MICSNVEDSETNEYAIRFIDFSVLKKLREFPRNPDCIHLTCKYSDINRANSLMIFISHCWLRGNASCDGWKGVPHPDNALNEKFELCLKGIEKVLQKYASHMKHCFVWIDHCCMDQINRSNIPKELKRYDKIVEFCDLIFTPIVDVIHIPMLSRFGPFEDLTSPLWNGDHSQSYLNRAWCRCEMMYAANIPLLSDTSNEPRHTVFKEALSSGTNRPHLLCGRYFCEGEYDLYDGEEIALITLTQLQRAWFEKYSPLKGYLSEPSDEIQIQALMDTLEPHMWKNGYLIGYKGERNEKGEKHGQGMEVLEYEVYTGDFKHDRRDGVGSLTMEGYSYRGQWKNDKKHGQGVEKDSNGWQFEGDFIDGRCHLGTLTTSSGYVLSGNWDGWYLKNGGMIHIPAVNVIRDKVRSRLMEGPYGLLFVNGRKSQGYFRWKDNRLFELMGNCQKSVQRKQMKFKLNRQSLG